METNLFTIKVKDIIQEAGDCQTIILTRPSEFTFTPGECADLSFPDKEMYFKTFSFSSSPNESDLMVTFRYGWTDYKKRLAKLRVGDEMKMRIYGNTFNYRPEHQAVFIAGGIGITPFRSMLKFESEKSQEVSDQKKAINLIYLNDNEEFVFKDELNNLLKDLKNLKINYIVTQKEGRLNQDKLRQLVSFDANTISYISGPPGMVDATVEILEKMNIANIKIKTDSFDGYLEND